jgi:hypothetical protein
MRRARHSARCWRASTTWGIAYVGANRRRAGPRPPRDPQPRPLTGRTSRRRGAADARHQRAGRGGRSVRPMAHRPGPAQAPLSAGAEAQCMMISAVQPRFRSVRSGARGSGWCAPGRPPSAGTRRCGVCTGRVGVDELSASELAGRASVLPEDVERLVQLAILAPGAGQQPFTPGDVRRVRLASACAEAGLPLEGSGPPWRPGSSPRRFLIIRSSGGRAAPPRPTATWPPAWACRWRRCGAGTRPPGSPPAGTRRAGP